jgi:hypothetical protein
VEEIVNQDSRIELVSRVQLRAVLSGLAVAAGCLAVCLGFSSAVGLSTFQPTLDYARGLALGTIIWGAIALWISLFCGAYVAALVGRSLDGRTGVLHGLVVWGAAAGLIGAALVAMFSGFLPALMRLGGSEAQLAIPSGAVVSAHAVGQFSRIAGLTAWLYWAGIVGGLLTSIVGGRLGARSEGRLPRRRVGVRVPPTPGIPQPA